jgi:uncharacterized OB-fold protein
VFVELDVTAQRRRRLTKCADCGNAHEPGRSRCARCAERHRLRWHQRNKAGWWWMP